MILQHRTNVPSKDIIQSVVYRLRKEQGVRGSGIFHTLASGHQRHSRCDKLSACRPTMDYRVPVEEMTSNSQGNINFDTLGSVTSTFQCKERSERRTRVGQNDWHVTFGTVNFNVGVAERLLTVERSYCNDEIAPG